MKRGTTLVEVLVACTLMGLFTTMVAVAFTMAFRDYGAFEDKIVGFRNAVNGLDRMSRRLSLCQQIYAPNWGSTAAPTPLPTPYTATVQTPLVFSYYSAPNNGFRIVGYALDLQNGTLVEQTYGAWPGTPKQRVLANLQAAFTVTAVDPNTNRGYNMLQTYVEFRPRTGPSVPLANQVMVQSLGGALP